MSLGIVSIPAIAGLLFLILLLFNNWTWNRAVLDYGPVLDDVRQAKSDITAGYLWLNETIAETEFSDINRTLTLFDNAANSIDNALAEKTESSLFGTISANDQKLIDGLIQLKGATLRFRHNAFKLWNSKKDSPGLKCYLKRSG
jgi:hypothetical protein